MYKIFMAGMLLLACNSNAGLEANKVSNQVLRPATTPVSTTIHVMVALCDNQYQGIVPVPAAIGNGQNAATNLYWGCAFGIKSYFKKSNQWQLIKTTTSATIIRERLVFKHKQKPVYLVADAYDGRYIKQCTLNFLNACAGIETDTLLIDGHCIGLAGRAALLAYIGHNGLMDFNLPANFNKKDNAKREAIVLACKSKAYFLPYIRQTGATPLLWTTGLMAPEAYSLHDAIQAWLQKAGGNTIAASAAAAYARHQHCTIKAAQKLLVSGW
jgi:hypothetical protein